MEENCSHRLNRSAPAGGSLRLEEEEKNESSLFPHSESAAEETPVTPLLEKADRKSRDILYWRAACFYPSVEDAELPEMAVLVYRRSNNS